MSSEVRFYTWVTVTSFFLHQETTSLCHAEGFPVAAV